ncbi:MAG TPA: hypothetical protein VEB20_00095 [Azospirillaceae bacterium]|nr:hypothetical protein [Azospirillaceae bacterium]
MKYRCTIEVEIAAEDFRAVADLEARLKRIAERFADVAKGSELTIRERRRR